MRVRGGKRHAHDEERPARELRPDSGRAPVPLSSLPLGAPRALALQSMAGNAAVSSVVQRLLSVQRMPPAAPDFKKKPLTAPEAGAKLSEVRTHPETSGPLIASWVGYIVDKVKPPAGTVRSTYVSSFDTPKGGFSVSRELPAIPDLVVHAHYQRDKTTPTTAEVKSSQVKWADNEGGDAPPGKTKIDKPNYVAILGSNHDTVALDAWQKNPKRHEEREKVKEFERKKWEKGGRKDAWDDGGTLGDILGL